MFIIYFSFMKLSTASNAAKVVVTIVKISLDRIKVMNIEITLTDTVFIRNLTASILL